MKKLGTSPKAPGYVSVKGAEDCQRNRRKPFRIALSARSGFYNLPG